MFLTYKAEQLEWDSKKTSADEILSLNYIFPKQSNTRVRRVMVAIPVSYT
jgi:hypothetical protein